MSDRVMKTGDVVVLHTKSVERVEDVGGDEHGCAFITDGLHVPGYLTHPQDAYRWEMDAWVHRSISTLEASELLKQVVR